MIDDIIYTLSISITVNYV